jgi:hypothetical protein
MSDVFLEWQPFRLALRPAVPPAGGSLAQLDAYASHLRALNLPDPTRVSGLRVAIDHVRGAVTERKTNEPDDFAQRVAEGGMSAEDALRQMAKRRDREEEQRAALKREQDADELVRDLLHRAALSIYEYGAGWLDLLRPIAVKALEARDPRTWDACVSFSAWLRDPMVGICAVAPAMQNSSQDTESIAYHVANARELFLWRAEHSDARDVTPGSPTALPEGGHVVPIVLSPHAAIPTVVELAENREAWGVGVFSGAEVIANQDRAIAKQDREIARLMGQPDGGNDAEREQPQRKKSRMAVT